MLFQIGNCYSVFFFIGPFYMEISPLYEQLLKLSLLPEFPGGSEISAVGLGPQQ